MATTEPQETNGVEQKPVRRRQTHGARLHLPFENRHKDAGEWAYDHRVGLSVMIICYLVLGIVFVGSKIILNDKPHLQGIYIDLQDLETLAEEKGLLFLVTYTYMGHVTAKHIRCYIAEGKLGKIRTVMAEYPQGWLAYEGEWGGKQGEWRCDPKQSGGVNCLGDLGTHVENAVSMLTGLKIRRVLAKMDVVVPGRVLDDNDVVLVEYEGGATGCYWTSQFAIGHDNDLRVRIYGENGSILWAQEECEKVTMIDRDGTIVERHRGGGGIEPAAAKYGRLPAGHTEGWLESMGNLYRSFMECLHAKKDGTFEPGMIDFPTVHDGAEGVRFVQACLQSNQQGNAWVTMDENA